jgi:NADPH-dependent glutamate synthase beta subunit-like oxidoreductase
MATTSVGEGKALFFWPDMACVENATDVWRQIRMKEKHIPKAELAVPVCREGCPAGIDVPRYIRRIKEGKFDEALAVIRERIPFPSICGYACYSPCEERCGNRQFGEPVAIRALKRAAAERGGGLWRKNLTVAADTGKRIAVVGSGPSGLTAAYYLATLGHKVTVIEALDQPGGMMRVGIPEYRLPREALDKEIGYLREIGVDIQTGQGVDSVDRLFNEGYNAVYLACGAQRGARLGIPGDDASGVIDAIAFLRDVNSNKKVKIGDRVAVVGGGNSAVDAARCAIRLGAGQVTVIYRRSRAEMPAYEEEVSAAMFESVAFEFLATPLRIDRKNDALELTIARTELGKVDKSGRPRPVVVEGSEFTKQFDTVIAAVGQALDLPDSMGLPLTEKNLAKVVPDTLATDRPGLFAGGDMVSGPASIIQAIAHGRKAAASIDRFLGGSGDIDQDLAPPEEEVVVMEYAAEDSSRVSVPCMPLTDRTCSFRPVELGITEEVAIQEAERCRNCDARQFSVDVHGEGCKDCGYCIEVCGLDVFETAGTFNKRGYRPVRAVRGERCVGCMLCFYACPDFSIDIGEKK